MQKRKIFFSFVLSALLSILLYIVLHEAGHCIVAILCGATITEFSILSAHMRVYPKNCVNEQASAKRE